MRSYRLRKDRDMAEKNISYTKRRHLTKWISLAIVMAQPMSVGAASTVVTPDARQDHPAMVSESANGVTIVDVRRPNAAGLSHNKYTDLQVGDTGIIFNNSQRITTTELAGYIKANPAMAGTQATTILNEVTGVTPTAIRGAMEIAGPKANLIMANPNGIYVDNGRFINTDRAVLTTGFPVIQDGRLTAMEVAGGTITVAGKGLDMAGTSRADILAEAVRVNAGIWANDLHVVTGDNTVVMTGAAVAKMKDHAGIGLDVAAIGGMYANRITLIGTEQGLGVNNAGTISALTGDVIVSEDGQVHVSHRLTAKTDTTLRAHTVTVDSGAALGGGTLNVQAHEITNQGTMGSTSGNTSITVTGEDTNTGTLVATGAMQLTSKGAIYQQGGTIQGETVTLTAGTALDTTKGHIQAARAVTLQAPTLIAAQGHVQGDTVTIQSKSVMAPEARIQGSTALTMKAHTMQTAKSTLEAGKILTIDADTLQGDTQHLISNGTMDVNVHTLDATRSTLYGKKGVRLTASDTGTIAQGTVYSEGNLTVTGGEIDASGSTLQGDTGLTMTATTANLTESRIHSGNDIVLTADTLRAQEATVATNGTVTVTGREALVTTDATIAADKAIRLTAGTLTGDRQRLRAGTEVTMDLASDVALTGGYIEANDAIQIHDKGQVTNKTALRAGQQLSLVANGIRNTEEGTITADDLSLHATEALENTGRINGGQYTTITAESLKQTGSARIYGDTVRVAATQIENLGTYGGTAPVIAARQSMAIGAASIHNTEHALIQAEENLAIGRYLTDDGVTGKADWITNESATIEGGRDVVIAANEVRNRNLHFTTKKAEIDRKRIEEVAGSRDGQRYQGLSPTYYSSGGSVPSDVIAVFYDESDHLSIYGHHYEDWWKFNYERVTIADVVDTSDPGTIVAGRHMLLDGNHLVNDKSKLIAGGTLTTQGSTVQNIEADGIKTYYDTGMVTQYWRDHERGTDSTGSHTTDYTATTAVAHSVPMTNYGGGKSDGHTRPAADSFRPIETVTTAGHHSMTIPVGTGEEPRPITLNGLYAVSSDSSVDYYIETDPAYTNRRDFLSSDYFMNLLKADPDRTAKRLGDGYYEMQLIKEQIFSLTGRRYEGAVTDDEAQYKALMDAAVAYAKNHDVTIGMALSPEQQKELTESMVWMVETAVLLPNGKIVTALVPQVYIVRDENEQHLPSVAVISGNTIDMKATNAILNTGTVIAGDTARLAATNINNRHGRIVGNAVGLTADESITNLGGTIQAVKALEVTAGKDITVGATTASIQEQGHTATVIDGIGTMTVTGEGGILTMKAGHDVVVAAGRIETSGANSRAAITAGRDIRLDAVKTTSQQRIVSDAKNTRRESHTHEVGSVIGGNGAIVLTAGRDITATGATVAASDTLAIGAGRAVTLTAATDTTGLVEDHYHVGSTGGGGKQVNQTHDEETTVTRRGTTLSGKNVTIAAGTDLGLLGAQVTAGETAILVGGTDVHISGVVDTRKAMGESHERKRGLLSKEATDAGYQVREQVVKQSTVSGTAVTIAAGRDARITASAVAAKDAIDVNAGKNLTVDTLANTVDTSSYSKTKKSGLSFSGLGVSIGSEKLAQTNTTHVSTPVGATISALHGTTQLQAGEDVHATTAYIDGETGVAITGRSVTLDGTYADRNSHSTMDYKKSGLTLSLGGTAVETVTTVGALAKQAGTRDNKTLAALEYGEATKELTKGIKDVQTYQDYTREAMRKQQAMDNTSDAKLTKERKEQRDDLIHIQVSLGSSKSSADSTLRERIYTAGTVASKAGEITIKATGDTADTTKGNITAIGQTIRGKVVDVEAKGDVNLLAGTNTTHVTEDSKSSGWSIGASIGTTGFLGGDIGINKAKSEGLTDKATHTGTTVVGSDAVQISSGKDTNMIGSQVQGNQITAKIGGDLQITSLQDTDNYKANSKSSSLSVGFSGVGITSFTPYAGKGTTNSTYESVTNQAGIYAGTDGYDITVKDNTTLTGSVIDSKATPDKNSLTTDTLTMKDIENKAVYEDSYRGIGYTYDRKYETIMGKAKDHQPISDEERTYVNDRYNRMGLVPDLGMPSSDSVTSTTKSAIAPGKLTVTKEPVNRNTVNRNTKNALNELGKIFDKKKLEERQELAKLFAKNANEAIHSISESKGWENGSKEKMALHTLVSGITAQLGGQPFADGAIAGGINEAVVGKLMDTIGKDNPDMVQIASAVLGYATNKLVGKDGEVGAAVAQWGTKWNILLERIPEFRNSLRNYGFVNNLPLGYGHILTIGGGDGVNVGEAAIIFHADGGNPVFISSNIGIGVSAGPPISGTAGKIWLEGPNGGVVVDPEIIANEMKGWGGNGDYAIGGSYMVWGTDNGYTVHVISFGPDAHAIYNISYTDFLGYQNQI